MVDDQPVGRFAVNLLNASESNLTKKQVLAQKVLKEEIVGGQMGYVEIWRAIALFSLLFLVVEWVVYCVRTVSYTHLTLPTNREV